MRKNVSLKLMFVVIFSNLFLTAFSQKQGRLRLGKGGEIENGNIKVRCTKPAKRYTRSVETGLDAAIDKLKIIDSAKLKTSVKTEVIKLTDYSQKGLDLDLVLFRLCQMGNNRLLSQDQTNDLISEAIKSWSSGLSIKEQRNVIAQLQVELESNLKTAGELKLNCQTILSSLLQISGDQILRNPKIQILATLFPKENLDSNSTKSVQELVSSAVDRYTDQKLDTNGLEKNKFFQASRVIALTIEKTLPTLNSLADKGGLRYPISSQVWSSNSSNLSKIEIFDVSKFQRTYKDLNSLKVNYDVVNSHSLAYLEDLKIFFSPAGGVITQEGIEKILTSERLAYSIIKVYAKSLTDNIESIKVLQDQLAILPL